MTRMTNVGKALVVSNLALSILLASWAQAIYSSRIDWSNEAGKNGAADGRLRELTNRITELNNALIPAATSWNASRATLVTLEERRTKDRLFYESELAWLYNGAARDNPARAIKLEKKEGGKSTLALLGRDDRMEMVPARDALNQPLLSWSIYRRAQDAAMQSLDEKSKALTTAIQRDDELTAILIGDPDKGIKGLQHRLVDEREKLANVLKEQEFVRPLLVNAAVDAEIIMRRGLALDKRVKELEKTGVASE
ncbi:MAG: hypothetical protein ACRD36_06330 [Candidatus Acidiferrum sp.]